MKFFQKRSVAAIVMILAIFAGLSTASARKPESTGTVSGTFEYILHNEDGVISQSTMKHIEAMNESLFAQTGAQIVVDVVDTTGTRDIADYGDDLFVQRGIGSRERDNGILLVLALRNLFEGAPDGDYYMAWGGGFSDSQLDRLEDILVDNMEDDFAAKRYDAAVLRTFDALIDYLEGVYHVTVRENAAGVVGDYQARSGGYYAESVPETRTPFVLGSVIGMVILLVALWMILDAFRYRRYRRRYIRTGFPSPPRYYPVFWGRPRPPRRPPPPPPPPGPRPGGAGRAGGFHTGGLLGGGARRPSGTSRPSGGFHSGGSLGGGARRPSSPGRSPGAKAPRSSGGMRRPSGGARRSGGGRPGGGGRRR